MEQMADTHKSFLMGWQSAKTRVRSLRVQRKTNIILFFPLLILRFANEDFLLFFFDDGVHSCSLGCSWIKSIYRGAVY